MSNVNRFIETNTLRWHPLWGSCDFLLNTNASGLSRLVLAYIPHGEHSENDVVFFDDSSLNYFIFDTEPKITVTYGNQQPFDLTPIGWYYGFPVFSSGDWFFYFEQDRSTWILRKDGMIGQVANLDGWGVEAYEVSDIPCFFPSTATEITLSPVDDTPEQTVKIKLGRDDFGFFASSTKYGEYTGYGTASGEKFRLGCGQWSGSDGKKYRELVYSTGDTARPVKIKNLVYIEELDSYVLGTYGSRDGWHQVNSEDVELGQAITLSFVSPSGASGENIELTWDGYMAPNDDDGAWLYVCDTICWR